jgi:hypothetical protein
MCLTTSKASLQTQNEPYFVQISNATYFAFFSDYKGSIFFKNTINYYKWIFWNILFKKKFAR